MWIVEIEASARKKLHNFEFFEIIELRIAEPSTSRGYIHVHTTSGYDETIYSGRRADEVLAAIMRAHVQGYKMFAIEEWLEDNPEPVKMITSEVRDTETEGSATVHFPVLVDPVKQIDDGPTDDNPHKWPGYGDE